MLLFAPFLPSRVASARLSAVRLSAIRLSTVRLPAVRRQLTALATVLAAVAAPAGAQTSVQYAPGGAYFRANDKFAASTGAEVYDTICAGCHMAQGKGAVGGGAYPALAANKNLASATYLVYTVINGRKAMPPFGNALDDAQIAQVTNYIRSQFGNAYTDTITAADVKAARPAPLAAAAPR